MALNTPHPKYTAFAPNWKVTRDLMNSNVKSYLPTIDPKDKKRTQTYKNDAQLINFTARTVNGLVGLVFRKEPDVELPEDLEYMRENADGAGQSLTQVAKETTEEVITTGREGVLADFPARDTETSARDAAPARARLTLFDAEEIINWCTEYVDGVEVLKFVIIHQKVDTVDDGYNHTEVDQYIKLEMIDGAYHHGIYGADLSLISETIPTQADGNTWPYIPFYFIGTSKNTPDLQLSAVYDIATINIGHYKNSASYEESIFVTGQPSLFFTTSVDADTFMKLNPSGIKYGARRGHNLGDTGNAWLLQIQPNLLADEGMKRKEAQALSIGARLLTPQASNETATAAIIRNTSEISVIDSIATNVSEGIEKALKDCARYEGADPEEVEFETNFTFAETGEEPAKVIAAIQLYDRQIISQNDMINFAKRAGIVQNERTNDEIMDEIETQDIGI